MNLLNRLKIVETNWKDLLRFFHRKSFDFDSLTSSLNLDTIQKFFSLHYESLLHKPKIFRA